MEKAKKLEKGWRKRLEEKKVEKLTKKRRIILNGLVLGVGQAEEAGGGHGAP